jgi:hypothetical protein
MYAALFFLVSAIICTPGCRRGLKIDITNQTNETLIIYYQTEPGAGDETSLGTLDPGTELGIASWQAHALTVIAKNSNGKTVYERRFTSIIFSSGEVSIFIKPGDLIKPSQ